MPKDYTQAAAALYRLAAEQGNASAQFNLGLLYDNGTGLVRDYAQAAAWSPRPPSKDFPAPQFNLGSMYANGQGVPVDLVQSYLWLDLAAKGWSGSRQQDAAKARDLVAQHLTPSDLAAAQDRVAKWQAAHQK